MITEVEVTWRLRTLALAEDGREFEGLINGAMEWLMEQPWWSNILSTGKLNRKQCRDLWKWLGRTDKAPKRLTLFVSRSDFERLYPNYPKAQR